MVQEDLLGRAEFISMIEMAVSSKVENHAGCSLAIDGKWGCGKSFILKMLESNLRGRGYFVVHYNCWQNDYYEEPLVAILSVLIDALNAFTASESNQEQKKEKTKRIALKLFKSISFMIVKNKLGVDFEKIGFDLDNVKNDINEALKEDGSKLLDDSFDSNQPLKTSIEIIYNQLLKIKEEWKGVVLVVDELDRCAPEYAIKVLERLHHICYDTEHDLFQFVQLVAINREELCDGISKAYGRGFIADAYSGIHSSKSYFLKTGSRSFGNYYLQKFIQMIIPVPRGRAKNSALPLLNGFEKNFAATDESYNQLVRDLFEIAFCEVSIRTKEEIVELAQTVHQITLARSSVNGSDQLKPSTVVLCVELLDVFCLAIQRKNRPSLHQEANFDQKEDFEFLHHEKNSGFVSLNIETKDEFVNDADSFATDVFDAFKVENFLLKKEEKSFAKAYGIPIPEMHFAQNKDEQFVFKMNSPKAEVLWFYMRKDDKFQPEDGKTPSEDDMKFVRAFRNTLAILT